MTYRLLSKWIKRVRYAAAAQRRRKPRVEGGGEEGSSHLKLKYFRPTFSRGARTIRNNRVLMEVRGDDNAFSSREFIPPA